MEVGAPATRLARLHAQRVMEWNGPQVAASASAEMEVDAPTTRVTSKTHTPVTLRRRAELICMGHGLEDSDWRSFDSECVSEAERVL